jgi:peptidyl-prolyl cis-trans isomerase B (cyclophilin B)
MQLKRKSSPSWLLAIWIYLVAFFLVAITSYNVARAEETKNTEDPATEVAKVEKKSDTKKSENKKSDKKAEQTKSADKADKKGVKSMLVLMETSLGPIKIKLDGEKAPKTVENFLKYVDDGFYNGTIFHRVIKGFMIQGGGFTSDLNQKQTRENIKNEANNGLLNKRGTLAMARTMDPHSASAQFFINTVDNTFLNFKGENMQGWGYAVFGEVVEGLDIVDKITAVSTTSKKGYDDVPETAIEIKSAKRVEK